MQLPDGLACRAQVKRDLRMLRLRGAFDPKRFYKSADATKFPKYFQMGTVVEGPTDFYSGASGQLLLHWMLAALRRCESFRHTSWQCRGLCSACLPWTFGNRLGHGALGWL